MSYDVLLYSDQLSPLGLKISEYFNATEVESYLQLAQYLQDKKYRVFVFDAIMLENSGIERCEGLIKELSLDSVPLVLLSTLNDARSAQKAFDAGCDDLIDHETPIEEAFARINKSIFNQIASTQLNQRLIQATETARNALIDNSDLGANIQFLLKVHGSDNLDQLGQEFFSTIQRYGLSCSLQMRSLMGVKNMEANGMAKDLESKLLSELKDKGRYVDFGRRSIVNYDRVSLLIKNMPMDDKEKYGAIKDNTFCLVQGINSRLVALEDRQKLIDEKESLHKLSSDVKDVIGSLKSSYQDVMRKIVNQVENASESIEVKLPSLALTEADEEFLESVTQDLLLSTNQIFNDGLRVDCLFEKLERAVQCSLEKASGPSNSIALIEPGRDGDDVELF